MAGKGRTVDIYTDAVPRDGQELKAGKYQVVVNEAGTEVQFLKSDKVVARHASQCLGHTEQIRYNEARYIGEAGKKQHLTEIRLAGMSRILKLDVEPAV